MKKVKILSFDKIDSVGDLFTIDSELREDGVTVFKEIKLEYVGLCMNENLDPEIKPL